MTKESKKIGRPPGTPNKRTSDLLDIAKKHNCDPFEVLILFAKGDFESLGYEKEKTVAVSEFGEVRQLTISPELRQKSAKDACEYLHPKRKAIEHTFNPKDAADEELIEQTKRLLEAAEQAK